MKTITVRKLGATLAAAIAGVLAFAATASATVTISSTGLSGTTSIQATDNNPVSITLSVETAVAINSGALTCNTTPTDACDQVQSTGDGSEIVAGPGCINDGSQGTPLVVCPDASNFNATLGSGNDALYFAGAAGEELEYHSATVNGGGGNDTLVGASPVTPAFPDVDNFSGGDGDDTIKGQAGNDALNGGPGMDRVEGGPGNDAISGGDGPDFLYGNSGDDTENGGAGDDHFFGRQDADAGNDTFSGGSDQDTLDYLGADQAVTVSLDGAANDGQPGEADNVISDVEEVDGTVFADTLSAGAYGATLSGNGGNDALVGGPGNDRLIGAGGDDIETGGGGADSFFGDDMSCSTGFFGGCNAGNDTINAVDGVADQLNCGPGADIAKADAIDVVATDPINGCETVNRTAAVGGGSATGSKARSLTLFTLTKFKGGIRGFLAHGLKVRIGCAAPCSLTATASVNGSTARKAHLSKAKSHAVVVGTARKTLLAAGTADLTIKPTSKAKRRLKHMRHLDLAIKVTEKTATATTSKTKSARF